jgi:hypothetical protein
MAILKLDILVIPTYNTRTLGIADASIYPTDPPDVVATIKITIPGFAIISLPFNVNSFTVYTSSTLGLTPIGTPDIPLPDGVYFLEYTVYDNIAFTWNTINRSIVRVERLQEKFDEAFMKLDMMECDRAIKTQSKVDLNSIYFFIQGAIAAANNCATEEATKLYIQADRMLNNFISNNCGCSGNNYTVNFNTYGAV